jgi:acyl carrier protein
MHEGEAVELVIAVVSKSRAVDPSLLSGSTHFVDDLGFDSLDASELLAALHSATGRRLAITDLSELETVGQVAKALVAQEVPQ